MKKANYDYIIVTHIPAFYKINLYNELAKKIKILVVFIAEDTSEKRSKDFNHLNNANFEYKVLNDFSFQDRNKIRSCFNLLKYLNSYKFKKIILSGWDLPEYWLLLFRFSKKYNCLALESTELESTSAGIKGLIKKIFISRISTVFSSGSMHSNLLEKLGYSGVIRKTLGVGIINKNLNKKIDTNGSYNRRFLFIGRLTLVKNLEPIIYMFNELNGFKLSIVGEGEDENSLRNISGDNINFLGALNNSELYGIFDDHDFLILPSLSEPWGLVVEEALYHGVPVIISDHCGSKDLVINNVNGILFKPNEINKLKNTLLSLDEVSVSIMTDNANNNSIDEKDLHQIDEYIQCLS
ncbi:TPA: glycosyltransferase [Photobacterium damselae]